MCLEKGGVSAGIREEIVVGLTPVFAGQKGGKILYRWPFVGGLCGVYS